MKMDRAIPMKGFILLFVLVFSYFNLAKAQDLNVNSIWEHYKKTFVSKEGYVVDPYNNYRVTSEAEAYTMLISASLGDKDTFYKVWNWTDKNLKRKDNLFSWLFINKVIDKNNATDADIIIAYSLLLGYKKWRDPSLLDSADKTINAIKKLIIPICWNDKTNFLLIPGKEGYIKNNNINLMLAYYIPFAFKAFYGVDKDKIWKELYNYSYYLYNLKNVSTEFTYDLYKKKLEKGDYIDINGLRFLIYAYFDNPSNIEKLRESLKDIYEFYKKKGYIPMKYNFKENKADKTKAPFCFYYIIGKTFNNETLIKEAENEMEKDKNNYYCYALLLISLLHK